MGNHSINMVAQVPTLGTSTMSTGRVRPTHPTRKQFLMIFRATLQE